MTTTTTGTQPSQLSFAQRDTIISSAIDEVAHIATLPEVTVRIVELVENPASSAHDLHMLISNDPALSARVLKVVNSAFYALPGQIGSINRAIVLLGLNAVKNIAVAASLAKLFRGGKLCPGFTARDLWEHSIAVACGSRMLSQAAAFDLDDEAFLGGLIHDLGVMVEMQVRRGKLIQVIERLEDPQKTFRQAEIELLGVTHEQFGQGLCDKWKFPAFLGHVAGFHHRPDAVPGEARALVASVHTADVLAARAGIGFARTVDGDQPHPAAMEMLGMTHEQIEAIGKELDSAVEVADSLLG
jgi:HD-like signal output (HDOD) protein